MNLLKNYGRINTIYKFLENNPKSFLNPIIIGSRYKSTIWQDFHNKQLKKAGREAEIYKESKTKVKEENKETVVEEDKFINVELPLDVWKSAENPKIKAMNEYPEWLYEMIPENQPVLDTTVQSSKKKKRKAIMAVDPLDIEEVDLNAVKTVRKRYWRKINRQNIRAENQKRGL